MLPYSGRLSISPELCSVLSCDNGLKRDHWRLQCKSGSKVNLLHQVINRHRVRRWLANPIGHFLGFKDRTRAKDQSLDIGNFVVSALKPANLKSEHDHLHEGSLGL